MTNTCSSNLIFLLILFASFLSSCSSYPTIRIEDSELESRKIESNFNVIRAVDFSSDGNLMVITGEAEGTQDSNLGKVEIWDTNDWELIQTLETEKAYNLNAYFVSEDNEEVVVVNTSGEVSIWNTTTGARDKVLVEGAEGENIAMPVDFLQSQKLLSLISSLGDLISFDIDAEEGYEVFSLDNNDYRSQSIAFSEEGTYLAFLVSPQYVAEGDNDDALPSIIYVFDTETWEQISSTEIESYTVIDMSFIDDRYFVLSGIDGFLEIRNAETGEIAQNLSKETPLDYTSLDSVRIVSKPDNNFFAVGSAEAVGVHSVVGAVTLWNSDSPEPLCSTGRMSATTALNAAVAISPNGKHLAAAERSDVIVWDIKPCF